MSRQTEYVGHDVINDQEQKIGTITDVLFDDTTNQPKWLVVNPGVLQAERIVPIEGSYETADGDVVVPYDKKWIKSGPRAGDHVMTKDVTEEAAGHYDIEM